MNVFRTQRARSCASWALFIGLLVTATGLGCGKSAVPAGEPLVLPNRFSDETGEWERSSQGLTDQDNQSVGEFFDDNPELLGSPEWTGQPEKYVSTNSSSLCRIYWFGGSVEHPTWNALEIDGRYVSDLSGHGVPGAQEQN